MKKVLALALALVMAFSMSAMAFAAETTTAAKKIACGYCDSEGFASSEILEKHIATYHAPADEKSNTCPVCNNSFADESEYNAHIAICEKNQAGVSANISIQEILAAIIELVKGSMGQWDAIESVVIRLIDFVQKITELGVSAVSQAEVKGAVADLENALADVKIPGIDELLNGLKQKVKDLYAGEIATVPVEETTVAEDLDDNLGSSSVGIALFAAVSVAAAAAYVCTKKSK